MYALIDGTFGQYLYNQSQQWGFLDLSSSQFDQGGKSVETAKPIGYAWRVGPAEAGAGTGGFYDMLGPNNNSVGACDVREDSRGEHHVPVRCSSACRRRLDARRRRPKSLHLHELSAAPIQKRDSAQPPPPASLAPESSTASMHSSSRHFAASRSRSPRASRSRSLCIADHHCRRSCSERGWWSRGV